MDAFNDPPQVRLISIERLEENKGQLAGVPENPRTIQDDKFALLKQAIIDYPEFLKYNPLKVYQLDNGNFIVLCGNMRFLALTEIGIKAIPCVVIDADTPTERLKAYAMLDNSGFGEYDWVKLKNGGWGDDEQLTAWGVDLPDDWNAPADEDGDDDSGNESYSRKVVAPTYEPSGKMPSSVKVRTMGNEYVNQKRLHHRVNWTRTAPKILNEKYKKQT